MDYFSELLESYNKLKKRTFKLTYICEQEDPNEITSQALNTVTQLSSTAEFPYELPGTTGAIWQSRAGRDQGFYTFVRDLEKYRGTKKGGFTTRVYNDINDDGFAELRSFLTGVEKKDDKEETQTQIEADAEAIKIEEIAAQRASYFFKKQNYDLNQVQAAIAASEESIKNLLSFCSTFTNAEAPAPDFCENAGIFITNRGQSSFIYKIVNGRVFDSTGDAKTEPPPALLNAVAENHRDFLKVLYEKPDEKSCKDLNNKVGYKDGMLLVYGKDYDSETGKPTTGLVLPSSDNALYQQAFKAIDSACKDSEGNSYWKPEKLYTQKFNSKALNTIRGTVNEMALVAAVEFAKLGPNSSQEDRKKIFKIVAEYVLEKKGTLLEFAKSKLSDEERVATDIDGFIEEQVLSEQAELAKDDRALIGYAMNVISKHLNLARTLKADGAYDASKQGGQGARSDTTLFWNTKEQAISAARKMGLDPNRAVRKGASGTPAEGKFEIGMGQKDKYGGVSDFKMGEYNTTARIRAAFRGDIKVGDSWAPGFYKWAEDLQFGGPTDDPTIEVGRRYQRMMDFEETLESEVKDILTSLEQGKFYFDSKGSIKSQSGQSICSNIAKIFKEKVGYGDTFNPDSNDDIRQELYNVFVKDEKQNWSDKAKREYAAEKLSRAVRLRKVQQAAESSNPTERQAARDWIIRTTLLTGGNATDIGQLQTSYDENRSVLTDHNAVLREMCKNQDAVDFNLTSRSSIGISINGFNISLGFEGTDAPKGVARTRDTRTQVTMSKTTALDKRISKEIKGRAPKAERGSVNADTMYDFLLGQMKLLEQILNSSK